MIARNVLVGALLVTFAAAAAAPAQGGDAKTRMPVELTKSWAIQAGGRVKPLLTFADETTEAITGRRSFDGLSALEIVWGYNLAPADFRERPYLRIDSKKLKGVLGLPEGRKRFSFMEIMKHRRFQEVAGRAAAKESRDEALEPIERDALDVYHRLELIAGLIKGDALRIVPRADAHGAWQAPTALQNAKDPLLKRIFANMGALHEAWHSGDAESFRRAAESLTHDLRAAGPDSYPTPSQLSLEVFYEEFQAFRKAWIAYLLGFLIVLLFGFWTNPWGYRIGLGALLLGFLAHTLGIGLRWVIAARAPVSDMYESLVFMGWGTIAIGLILEFIYRRRFFGLVAGLMGFLCLLFAEHLPLDSSINPLVPVLANTYWLTVHVMTIMLAYSALALNMGLGHVVIWIQLFRPGRTALLRTLSQLNYKTMQVGLLFLAAGIVFGAIWANESWGRYWGWDPKETWSLITFFVYLAIVHARFAGWLHNFGLAVASIAAFLSVVMTYYGVNFVLAAGLHSYGRSEGGIVYAILFCLFELLVITGAFLRYRSAIRPRLQAEGVEG